MPTTLDNQLEIQTTGTNDWQANINSCFSIMERGQHITLLAGMDINTGHVVENTSVPGYARHCNGNSATTYRPIGIAYYAVTSGQPINVLARGVLRGLEIMSRGYLATGYGFPSAIVSPNTPGVVESWGLGAGYVTIGIGIPNGILFTGPKLPATI